MSQPFKLAAYQACLFDADKTLTTTSRKVTPRTREAVKRLYDTGIKVGVCSGRYYATLKDYIFPYFPKGSKHITAGGAQIVDTEGKIYWEERMSAELVKQLVSRALASKFTVVICAGDVVYSSSQYRPPESKNVLQEPLDMLAELSVPLVTIYDVDQQFLDFLGENNLSFKSMQNYEGRTYVDVTAKGITKRQGLIEWCKLEHLEPKKVIGFGDSDNDLEFLSSCGYGVAMGNATEKVKAEADEVIGTCDEDGVADFVERNI